MRIYSGGKSIQVLGKQGIRGMAGPDGNPIGTIIDYAGTTPPVDYLVCNGAQYKISEFPDLADFYQTQFGDKYKFGGGGDSFAVPNFSSEESILKCIKATETEPYEDVYSQEETAIGRWIDGRPIYRISGEATGITVVNQWYSIHPPIKDIDVLFYGVVIKVASSNTWYCVNFPGNSSGRTAAIYDTTAGLRVLVTDGNVLNQKMKYSLVYLKTTDNPIA